MTEFAYYESRKPKWIVTAFAFVIAILLFPSAFQNPAPFFWWVVISGTFTVLAWTRKKSKKPKLVFDSSTIRTERGDIFNIKAIEKIELAKIPAWRQYAPIYLILYFKDNRGTADIEVSGLDKSPNEILSKLNFLIS